MTRGRAHSEDEKLEIMQRVCDAIATHPWGLAQICSDPKFDIPVERDCIMRWLAKDARLPPALSLGLEEMYTQAKDRQVELLVDEVVAIADDGSGDYVERERADGRVEVAYDKEHVQRSRLRCDARFKLAAMLKPAKYGTKHVEHDAGPSLQAALVDRLERAREASHKARTRTQRSDD